MLKAKKDHYPSATLACASLLCGVGCFLLFWFGPTDWLDAVLYAYLFFFGVAVILGGYSLCIKRSTRGWTAVVVGLIFIILFLIGAYILSNMRII